MLFVNPLKALATVADDGGMKPLDYKKIRLRLAFQPTYTASLGALMINGGLWAATYSFFQFSNALTYILSLCVAAVAMNHSYLIIHECAHSTFFPKHWQNILVGHVYSILALVPFYARKFEHLHHHLWTGNVDFEPATVRGMQAFSKLSQNKLFEFAWRYWIPVFAFHEHKSLWKIPFSGQFKDLRRKILSWFSVFWSAGGVIVLVIYLGPQTVAKLLPAVYLFLFLIELTNLPHHLDATLYDGDQKRPLWEHDELTKSCQHIPYITYALMLNFNFHVEHHLFPAMPWHRLYKVHTELTAADPRYQMLHNEVSWGYSLRRQPVEVVFKKYLDFVREHDRTQAA